MYLMKKMTFILIFFDMLLNLQYNNNLQLNNNQLFFQFYIFCLLKGFKLYCILHLINFKLSKENGSN